MWIYRRVVRISIWRHPVDELILLWRHFYHREGYRDLERIREQLLGGVCLTKVGLDSAASAATTRSLRESHGSGKAKTLL